MRSRFLPLLGLVLFFTVPGAAQAPGPVPPGLKGLKPHEIVDRVLDERDRLQLSEAQITRLETWHVAVLDERHRFEHQGGKPHETRHVAMINQQTAFDSTVAVLTPAQRETLATLFARRP